MPNVYISDDVYKLYVDEYGYDGAKDAIKDEIESSAPADGDDERAEHDAETAT